MFVTGAGMTPVQASSRNMDTHSAVLKWVQVVATPGASPVTSTRDLESKCLKKERCALIMKAGPLEVCGIAVRRVGMKQECPKLGVEAVCVRSKKQNKGQACTQTHHSSKAANIHCITATAGNSRRRLAM